jgi:uncharacterized protein YbjT (DUF2867 family)
MYIVLGATGHVGSATARALLAMGKPVTAITREAEHAADLKDAGASIAIADVHDTDALRAVFRGGERLFLLNPPALPSTDTDAEERETIGSIVAAITGSGLERIVAESTYGARPGQRVGDLTTLFELEEALKAQPIPISIIRAAYYMSNLDYLLEGARQDGVIQSMFPGELKIPMVAPEDIGRVAARLLTKDDVTPSPHYVEGPQPYSYNDVAEAFSDVLQRPVRLEVIPREEWEESFAAIGFSAPAAQSYARMIAASVDGDFERPADPIRGAVTLQRYVTTLAGK